MTSSPERSLKGGFGRISRRILLESLSRAGLITVVVLSEICNAPTAHSATATINTQSLGAAIAANAKLSVPASMSFAHTGTVFNAFTGTLVVSYRARSTATGAGGTITVQASANFSPAGGPSVSSNTLTYTCSGATLGTACSGTQTVSLASATNILTIPRSACTGASCGNAATNTVNANFSLVDDPAYTSGTYSSSLLFTISST